MLETVLEVLFPRRCAGCRSPWGWPFCAGCAAQVAELSPPWCIRCGRPMVGSSFGCPDCPSRELAWVRAALLYEGPVRQAMLHLKFGGGRAVGDALAGPMARMLQRAPPGWSALTLPLHHPSWADVGLTWVPLGPRRKRARGYDQAEVLARAVGRRARLSVRRLLRRTAETDPQARRTGPERRRALAGAFQCVERPPRRVIVVDDVFTSGATGAECARALLAAGAREVGLLAAARSLGGGVPPRCYNPPELQPGSVVARERFSR